MLLYPHAKINLSLYIGHKRPDGYHEVDTIYLPIGLYDRLQVEKSLLPGFSASDPGLETENNLVLRACRLMEETDKGEPLTIHLAKGIPWEAGLGGGSADAAAMLKACNMLHKLGLSDESLRQRGSLLGADVPAGLLETPARGRGIGTALMPLPARQKLPLLIIKPDRGFSTAGMYGAWDCRGQAAREEALIEAAQQGLAQALMQQAPAAVVPFLHNDFESVLSGEEDAVFQQARSLLEAEGALAAHLCGSGSAVFGLYASHKDRQQAAGRIKSKLPAGWRLYQPALQVRKMINEKDCIL